MVVDDVGMFPKGPGALVATLRVRGFPEYLASGAQAWKISGLNQQCTHPTFTIFQPTHPNFQTIDVW